MVRRASSHYLNLLPTRIEEVSSKKILLSLVVLVVSIIGISFVLSSNEKKIAIEVFDLGKIKVFETYEKDFILNNPGKKPLRILNINSSCGCTVGKLIYKDFESKEFGMHAQSGYLIDIAPGESAIVKVIYRPFQMPVEGFVQREVTVTTDDQSSPRRAFAVKAYVEQ